MPIGKDSAHFFGINYAMPIDSQVGYSPIPVMPQDFSGQNLQGRSFKGQDLTGANFSVTKVTPSLQGVLLKQFMELR
ncbi:MAG: pentapeptide repeat-containing protein [Coleofasciculus chthonoplastes F2-STO-03]